LAGIETLTGMDTLWVDNNQITTLAGVTFPAGLRQLDLSGNQITALAGATFPSGLHYLYLSGNPITTLAGAAFPDWLEVLYLDPAVKLLLGEATFPGHEVEVCVAGNAGNQCEWYYAPTAVSVVAVSPTSAEMAVGERVQLSVTVTPSTASTKAVVWVSSNPAVASVNSSGLVSGLAVGTAIVTVIGAFGGRTVQATITVSAPHTSPPGSPPTDPPGNQPTDPPASDPSGPGTNQPVSGDIPAIRATGIALAPAAVKLAAGKTASLTATVTPAGAITPETTWTSSKPGVATVDDAGHLRAAKPGKTTITASIGTFAASTTVTVVKAKAKLTVKAPSSAKDTSRVSLKAKVTATAITLAGKITVTATLGKTKVSRTVTLKAKNNAKYVTVKLPALGKTGKWRLTIAYLGTGSIAKTSLTKRISVT
jgi:hypothetical protein